MNLEAVMIIGTLLSAIGLLSIVISASTKFGINGAIAISLIGMIGFGIVLSVNYSGMNDYQGQLTELCPNEGLEIDFTRTKQTFFCENTQQKIVCKEKECEQKQ